MTQESLAGIEALRAEQAMLAETRQRVLDQVAGATSTIVTQLAALNVQAVIRDRDFFSSWLK